MSKGDERRAQQEAYTRVPDDRKETPNHIVRTRECHGRTGQHDYSMRVPAPVGSGIKLYACCYCSLMSPRSKDRLAQWKADSDVQTNKT